MSRCEQELCPNWAGDDGCPCAVLGITREIVVDDRPFCPANWGGDVHNGPHSCILEDGHPESEHRCPCGEEWRPSKGGVG